MKTISVLGLGYMGLPTASLFATSGYKICGIDINPSKVSAVNKGKCPFPEPGLSELVSQAHKSKNLTAFTKIQSADIFIIAVPTPLKGHRAELKYVKSATEMVAGVIKSGNLVILESTVSPGTCVNLMKPILDKKVKKYYLSHCPERAIPGNTMYEIVHNDRIIGGIDEKSTQLTVQLYQSFVKGKLLTTDITTAETCKLMENTYRDVNIALSNELAKICADLEVNIWEAISLANHHPRVNLMQPGPGVGGHCLAIDPWFLTEDTKQAKLIPLARNINDSMPAYVVSLLKKKIKAPAVIGVLGVAYKKNVDDARETPAFHIIEILKKNKYNILATDPYVKDFEYPLDKLDNVLRKASAIILATDHQDYAKINFKKYSNLKFILDTRNQLISDQINSKDQTLLSI